MLTQIYPDNSGFSDLSIVLAGSHHCPPGHSYGPAVRNYYLIHFITSGKGVFRTADKEYLLEKHQGFLICPNEINYYEADLHDPWSYSWIGFKGLSASYLLDRAGLQPDHPIFYEPEVQNIFSSIGKCSELKSGKELYLLSILYAFFALLSKNTPQKRISYAIQASEFILANLDNEIHISDVASHLGIDRRYLSQLFRREYQMSPQQFIISHRMERAKFLLKNTSLNIQQVAASVGYNDALGFSRIFHKYTGMSPSCYKVSDTGPVS